ncbi:MAG: hypothetical protein ACR2PJ_02005 [Pseudomonadales bacterium]
MKYFDNLRKMLRPAAVALPAIVLLAGAAVAEARPGGKMLERLDSDGDGMVSKEEFQMPGAERLAKLDTNGDGGVSLDEMNAHRAERAAKREAKRAEHREKMTARIEEHFNAADENSDGIVTTDEAEHALFTHLDANGDGYIEKEEARSSLKRHKRHGKRHKRGRHHKRGGD